MVSGKKIRGVERCGQTMPLLIILCIRKTNNFARFAITTGRRYSMNFYRRHFPNILPYFNIESK